MIVRIANMEHLPLADIYGGKSGKWSKPLERTFQRGLIGWWQFFRRAWILFYLDY